MVMLSGLAVNAPARCSSPAWAWASPSRTSCPVQGSLLADQYPIGTRGRISAVDLGRRSGHRHAEPAPRRWHRGAGRRHRPAGGGRSSSWPSRRPSPRSSPSACPSRRAASTRRRTCSARSSRTSGPPRSRWRRRSPGCMQIRTIRTTIIAFAAMGFGLFTVPVLANLFLEDQYGLGSFGRGVVATVGGVAVLRHDPVRRASTTTGSTGVTRPRRCGSLGLIVLPAAAAHARPVLHAERRSASRSSASRRRCCCRRRSPWSGRSLTSVVPYRLRGMGSALGAIYIFFIGATGGALLAGAAGQRLRAPGRR